jgi:hypothetical protein
MASFSLHAAAALAVLLSCLSGMWLADGAVLVPSAGGTASKQRDKIPEKKRQGICLRA